MLDHVRERRSRCGIHVVTGIVRRLGNLNAFARCVSVLLLKSRQGRRTGGVIDIADCCSASRLTLVDITNDVVGGDLQRATCRRRHGRCRSSRRRLRRESRCWRQCHDGCGGRGGVRLGQDGICRCSRGRCCRGAAGQGQADHGQQNDNSHKYESRGLRCTHGSRPHNPAGMDPARVLEVTWRTSSAATVVGGTPAGCVIPKRTAASQRTGATAARNCDGSVAVSGESAEKTLTGHSGTTADL